MSVFYRYSMTVLREFTKLPRSQAFHHIRSANFSSDHTQFKEEWSLAAYNVCDRLMIERVPQVMENFKGYSLVQLAPDLSKLAIMFTSNGKRGEGELISNTQPLKDVFIFKSGSIVFWGVPSDQQRKFLDNLSPLKMHPQPSFLIQEEKEYLRYSLVNSSERSKLIRDCLELSVQRNADLLRLDQFTFSHVVAISVKLGIWEMELDRYIDSISWVTEKMRSGDDLKLSRDQVFRKTGEIYHLKHRINLSSDLLDLPDVYWDRHDQEVMFLSLVSFLNLKKRTAVMNEKLNNCCELMNLLAAHKNDKHHTRLELMIIALILIEVLFELSTFVK